MAKYDAYETVDVSDGDSALIAIHTAGMTLFVDLTMTENGGEATLTTDSSDGRIHEESDPFRWANAKK